jgi:uncharacterized damage-inducible protein DinB
MIMDDCDQKRRKQVHRGCSLTIERNRVAPYQTDRQIPSIDQRTSQSDEHVMDRRNGRATHRNLRDSQSHQWFTPHVVAFLGYVISHESHHRGQAGWALKLSGHPLDQKTAFGLWEWGVR